MEEWEMVKTEFKVGDLVKVSHASKQIYRISWIGNNYQCQIEAKNENGGWYWAENWDTSLLFKA